MLEAESINDICWYPWMKTENASTNCFLACSRDQPVHLWDVSSSTIRCSYLPMDHLDQLSTCYCVVFTPDGRNVVSGGDRMLHLFDSTRPGSSTTIIPITSSRKATDGQDGPISALACRQDDTALLAAGSFQGSVGIYDIRTSQPEQIMVLTGMRNGITQLQFSTDGWSLFVSARKTNVIWQWDLRNGLISAKYGLRSSETNQRIYFNLEGERLYSGDQYGNLLTFDTLNDHQNINDDDDDGVILPISTTKLSNDILSNVITTPHHPDLLATANGERYFNICYDGDTDDDIAVDKDDDGDRDHRPSSSSSQLCIWRRD